MLVAKENAKLNNVTAEFERSDLFDGISETFDVIVSNPPYIPTEVIHTLMLEVAQFEPYQALDGKEDGLYFYRKIIQECKAYLNPNGKILFEIKHMKTLLGAIRKDNARKVFLQHQDIC